jgi:hypothetical protein
MVAWTVVLLLFPAALWLWTLMAHLVRRNGSALASSPTQGTNGAKRKQSNRRASADGLPVLAVKRGGVATRLRRRRVPRDPGRAAAALAAPAQRFSAAREAAPMGKKAAAQHRHRDGDPKP